MRLTSGILISAALLIPALARAEWVPLAAGVSTPEEIRAEVTFGDASELRFNLEVPGAHLSLKSREGMSFASISIPGAGQMGEPGEPLLPAFRRFVEIPRGAMASVQVDVINSTTIKLAELGLPQHLYPAQRPEPKCACTDEKPWSFSYKKETYRGRIEPEPGALDGPFEMRDHQLVRLTLAPLSYNADTGALTIITQAQVTVRFQGGDAGATRALKSRLSSRAFDSFLMGKVLNLNLAPFGDWAYPDDAPIPFLIITPPSFVAALQPFVDWKTSCGYAVQVATTDVTGTTTEAIKQFITGLYNGPNPPVYILMVGDSPSPLVTHEVASGGNGGTDLPYVQMGPDLYPDLMIARWPVDDVTELVNMRDKILFYQQPTVANSAWLNRALFLAGDDYIPNSVTTHEDVREFLMDPAPNSAETEQWWGDNVDHTTEELIADLNTGRGWAVYSAHSGPSGWSGDPPFSSSDIPGLANANMYPLGFGHSCQSNMWNDYDDVFGEVTVTQANKGFVSYWGGSNNTYWDGDDWLERGFFDALIESDMGGNLLTLNRQYSNVAACYSGLTEVSLHGGGLAGEHYYWHLYNLDGDPTLDPFTRQPIPIQVDVPVAIPPVTGNFSATVTDTEVGAVPVALVAASQNGILLGAGLSDDTGVATFPISAPAAGIPLLVRVTAHNHIPQDSSVMVAAGSDGIVAFDAATYSCTSDMSIDVFDDDLDAQSTLDVTLSASSGASLDLTLNRVAGSVVRFSGACPTTDLPGIDDGDILTVTYSDSDTGSGQPGVKTDIATLDCRGPVISQVAVKARHTSMTVSFVTDEPGTTVVDYGETMPGTQVSDSRQVTSHEITIEGVRNCTPYLLALASADSLGNATTDDNNGLYYQVKTAIWRQIFQQTLASDPGWTMENGGSSLGWAFGQPLGQGGEYGVSDPTSGYTDSYVYGVNLAGDYENNLDDNQLQLLSPIFDLTDVFAPQLTYWRWLGVESPSYDHARVEISVDGGPWEVLWQNSARMNGGSWEQETLALPLEAEDQSNVRIRWTLGETDSSWRFAGWNLDDISLQGAGTCPYIGIFYDGFETGGTSHWGPP